MSFPQFAFNNIRRNARAYIAYFLSSAAMVMIFFSYAVFIYHPDVRNTKFGGTTVVAMQVAAYIVYIFAFFFVMYSIGVFLKSRNREFGILTILGAKAEQINRLVFLENMLIGLLSIITGVAAGMLLSKLFLLLSTRIIGIGHLPFYWPVKAFIITVVSFVLLFLAISLFTLLLIRSNNALKLLKGSSEPKKEPRVSPWFALLGLLLLTVGYLAIGVRTIDGPGLILAAITGIGGTYFFFTQLSVLLIRLIKRNRKLTWRGVNLLWVSEMSYKLKDNARVLFLITVVTAIASMSSALVLGISQANREILRDNAFAFRYTFSDYPSGQPDLAPIHDALEKQGVQYREFKLDAVKSRILGDSGKAESSISVLPLSVFSPMASEVGWEKLPDLADNEALLITFKNMEQAPVYKAGQSVKLDGQPAVGELQLKQIIAKKDTLLLWSSVLLVNDKLFSKLNQQDKSLAYNYYVPAWNQKLPDFDSPEGIAGQQLEKWRDQLNGNGGGNSGYLEERGLNYISSKQSTSLLSFVGVFVALIFSISSASFLYFKLNSELTEAGRIYHALSKIGLSVKEMNLAASLQIAVLFFIPIVVSAVQTLVVIRPFFEQIGIDDVLKAVLWTSSAFLLVQAVYFSIVRARYVHVLKKIMV